MERYIICGSQSRRHLPPEEFIADSGWTYVERRGRSIAKLQLDYQAAGVVAWHEHGPVLYRDQSKFFFHPSMAKNRLAAKRRQGIADLMTRTCELQSGDVFLDCTAGLGADAIVAAYYCEQAVTALESEAAIALVVKWGMRYYQSSMSWLQQAIDRVQLIHADHRSYLPQLADRSVDVVYFDPMFEHALVKSDAIAPLRALANHTGLESSTIQEACRVARRSVVVKANAQGMVLQRLGFKEIVLNSNGRIGYGLIHL